MRNNPTTNTCFDMSCCIQQKCNNNTLWATYSYQGYATFQEYFKSIGYILINEMSFIGPKLLLKIDSRLRETFPYKTHLYFGGLPMVFFGYLAKLPPIMDMPIYTSCVGAQLLWENFTIVATLEMLYHKQRDSGQQMHFRKTLESI